MGEGDGEKKKARFLLPSPQPPNCLHGQARKRPLRRRELQEYRAFSRDVMSAILVYLNNEMSAILVYQIRPAGV